MAMPFRGKKSAPDILYMRRLDSKPANSKAKIFTGEPKHRLGKHHIAGFESEPTIPTQCYNG